MRKEYKLLTQSPKLILTWIIAILFMIGASCFVIASAMSLNDTYSSLLINTIYFIGSLFFTSAAYGQYFEAINADITDESHIKNVKKEWIWFAFRRKNLGYLSSITQLIGTIFFNFNTFASFYTSLNPLATDILVWIPNMAGSILFLIASFFAWLEIYKDRHIKRFRSSSWWIVWSNNFGSIFFQISAVASFVYADSKVLNEIMAINYTLFGGVCFFIGAFLLIIEMRVSKETP